MSHVVVPAAPEVLSYVADPYRPSRRRTRVVSVGNVGIGGDNPIRIQSMTTTSTRDVEGTTAQAVRLVEAGCEIVRITAPTPADARAIGEVRQRLRARGIDVPLVADIHFNPAAAMEAVQHVEKVRVNPGNFADSRKFAVREYTEVEYQAELDRIAARFTPLVLACKERGVAMRIGTNHGSLSDRIMNRFGDSPLGMVESALEFVRICEENGYREIVLSMKASNPTVMIAAYRLLAARMDAIGMDYPLHLGVTEAGNGDDARIKSATGIGSLLLDGLGDTIRVSLAEEPEAEIPVAQRIVSLCALPLPSNEPAPVPATAVPAPRWDPFSFARRSTTPVSFGALTIGGEATIAVIGAVPGETAIPLPVLNGGPRRGKRPDALLLDLERADDLAHLERLAWKGEGPAARPLVARSTEGALLEAALGTAEAACLRVPAALVRDDAACVAALALARASAAHTGVLWLELDITTEAGDLAYRVAAFADLARECRALEERLLVGVRGGDGGAIVAATRLLAAELAAQDLPIPIVLEAPSGDEAMLAGASAVGSLLCDGIGDALIAPSVALAFDLLQGAGARLTRTDYVACPSCGRTLFDLQSTTDRIKARTSHLKGVKIAIMGCVVNGPGEMADADFGYMGGSPGQVNLYVGKQCVERGIPEERADDTLIALIKEHGRWIEPGEEDEE